MYQIQGRRNGFVIGGGAKKDLRGEGAQNFFELHFHIEKDTILYIS